MPLEDPPPTEAAYLLVAPSSQAEIHPPVPRRIGFEVRSIFTARAGWPSPFPEELWLLPGVGIPQTLLQQWAALVVGDCSLHPTGALLLMQRLFRQQINVLRSYVVPCVT